MCWFLDAGNTETLRTLGQRPKKRQGTKSREVWHRLRCRRTLRELIVLNLANPLPLSSQPATGLSALAPAQRAGAQRLCALALRAPPHYLGRKRGITEIDRPAPVAAITLPQRLRASNPSPRRALRRLAPEGEAEPA